MGPGPPWSPEAPSQNTVMPSVPGACQLSCLARARVAAGGLACIQYVGLPVGELGMHIRPLSCMEL